MSFLVLVPLLPLLTAFIVMTGMTTLGVGFMVGVVASAVNRVLSAFILRCKLRKQAITNVKFTG